MPADATLAEQSKHMARILVEKHPEIAWGCTVVRNTTGNWNDISSMLYSQNAEQFLSFQVGDDLSFSVFAFKSKVDTKKFNDLLQVLQADSEDKSSMI